MARDPVHPGESLLDELAELEMSAAELARILKVPPNRISQIVSGRRNISADTALRLGRYFGTGAEYWTELQSDYDLAQARARAGGEIERIPHRGAVKRS